MLPLPRPRFLRPGPHLAGAGVLTLVLVAGAWWMTPADSAATHGAGVAPQDSGPVLGELVGARYLVRIHRSREGPLYTVCTPDGQVLEAGLRSEDVYRSFPDLDIPSLQAGPDAVMMVVPDRNE